VQDQTAGAVTELKKSCGAPGGGGQISVSRAPNDRSQRGNDGDRWNAISVGLWVGIFEIGRGSKELLHGGGRKGSGFLLKAARRR